MTPDPAPAMNGPDEPGLAAPGLRALTSSRVWLIVGALAIIGLIEWLAAPAPATPRSLPRTSEPWHIPQPPKAQQEKALAILKQASLWGKLPDAAASKPPSNPKWHIVGIVKRGPVRFVMIQIEGQPDQTLTVGDSLPGGSKIVEIEDDKIGFLDNGKKRTLWIYEQGPQTS